MYYTISDTRTGYDARIPAKGLKDFGEITYSVSPTETGEPRLHIGITYGPDQSWSSSGAIGIVPDGTPFGPWEDIDNLPVPVSDRAPEPNISQIEVDSDTGKVTFSWAEYPNGQLGNTHNARLKDIGFIRCEYRIRDNIWKSYYKFQPLTEDIRKRQTIDFRFCVALRAPTDIRSSKWVYCTYYNARIAEEEYIKRGGMMMHPDADGTEKIEPLPYEPEPESIKRDIKGKDKMKMDWDTRTPWEKKIKVELPHAASHRRWSTWSDRERDVYARIVFLGHEISEEHGPRSRKKEEHVKYYEDVLIGFGRDHKAMPHWALNEHEEAEGYGDDVEVVWHQPNRAGHGKWIVKRKDTPVEKVVNPDIEAANRYRSAVGLPPVRPSQQDKFREALVEVNLRPDVVVKEFNPGTGKLEEIEGRQRTAVRVSAQKIMPSDSNFTPLEKSLNWAAETHHGPDHQERWNRIAAVFGADNGYDPMPYDELEEWWNKFNRNPRWSMARDNYPVDESPVVEEDQNEAKIENPLHDHDIETITWTDTNRLKFEDIAKLPEMTERQAKSFYQDNRGDSIEWVAQREPSVGPEVVSVLFHNNVPVYKKKSRLDEFEHLPYWTKSQAENYFIRVLVVGSYSRVSLDGHWNTVKGYRHPDTLQALALAATEKMEATEQLMNEATRANDWKEVGRLAALMETL